MIDKFNDCQPNGQHQGKNNNGQLAVLAQKVTKKKKKNKFFRIVHHLYCVQAHVRYLLTNHTDKYVNKLIIRVT